MIRPIRSFFFLVLFLNGVLSAQDIRTEEIPLQNDSIRIPGTLTYPAGEKSVPLVIYIHGSGNIDRHGNQPGTFVQAGYIQALRDALNAEGIGFFSYDKRTAVAENRPYLDVVVLEDYISDAGLALEYFKGDPRFSGIHLIGHSQGSLVGMRLARPPVQSLVSLAGPAATIDSVLLRQLGAQLPALAEEARPILARLKAGDSLNLYGASPYLQLLLAPSGQPLLRSWMQYNPATEIRSVTIPVLLLYGEMDTQVPPQAGQTLKEALPQAEWVTLPHMNHVLKQVTTDVEQQQAYTSPDVPLAPGLVETLVTFIRKVEESRPGARSFDE